MSLLTIDSPLDRFSYSQPYPWSYCSASPHWRWIWAYLYSTRRRMQTAADAAAVAGATALRDGESYTNAADDVASFNGFTNSQNNVTVTVSEPTLPSPYPSGVTYVEVDISQTVPTYFLRVLGYKSMKVGARAVSGAVAGPACIYALDPSGSGTFLVDW